MGMGAPPHRWCNGENEVGNLVFLVALFSESIKKNDEELFFGG
jgi:hypothetical protein